MRAHRRDIAANAGSARVISSGGGGSAELARIVVTVGSDFVAPRV